jgi:SsrA-binding protein
MKVVAQNRRARFDYQIIETVEAGIQLTGAEVKSCRAGQVNLAGAYVSFMNNVPVLKKAKISAYQKSSEEHIETRDRPLLLHSSQIDNFLRSSEQEGMTVVPLEIRAGKYIKVVLGLAKGRKKTDKRQVIRERETSRRVREGREV